ncbi:protein O-GlcNAcase [Brevibacillus dissolubilis]|uniref:protein O-GlcNAcase n=1 Tax=Brevibacillus dissolubilis TaxID=1844116 RepID=UPI001116DEEE|nr:protein O-GlcNAcase [Brevibacillus dissolubilis]
MKRTEPFAIRGVIEGFYGKPWSHEERLDMLDFMGRHGFNAYFYSPKDDPYLRDNWQAPHPADQLAHIDALIQQAKACGLHFYYCLSPGVSMEYANEAHVDLVVQKFKFMYLRGVRHFTLLFDDIPQQLMHEKDRNRFEHVADAHAQTVVQVWELLQSFGGVERFVVCPTVYNGIGREPYISYLGANIPKDIAIFWTGRFVCSPHLTDGDAIRFAEYTGHQPLYWDNYPVNDLAMIHELHLGPLMHRDPQLYLHSHGYVCNAMEHVESSKIPLITIADYLNDPEGYDPDKSYRRAIEEVVGYEDAEPFMLFADNVRSSFLNDLESPNLMDVLHDFRFQFLHGQQEVAVALLRETFEEMEESATYLLTRMKNHKLARETHAWIKKYSYWAKVGQAATKLIDAGRKGRMISAGMQLVKLKHWLRKADRMPERVCGSVMKLFAEAVLLEVKKQRI